MNAEEKNSAWDDPLRELRAAWDQVRAPAPPAELTDCDEATRKSVEWMRGAWSSLEAPPVDIPVQRRVSRE